MPEIIKTPNATVVTSRPPAPVKLPPPKPPVTQTPSNRSFILPG